MESNNNKKLLKFFESNEHPIDSDTRKHKVQLLLYSFLMWLCFFIKDKDVIMILGVKLEEAISPLELIPFIFILLFYHFILFCVQLDSSLKNWQAKKIKSLTIPYINSGENESKDRYSLNILEKNNIKNNKPNPLYLAKQKETIEQSYSKANKSHQDFMDKVSSLSEKSIPIKNIIRIEGMNDDPLEHLKKIKDNYLNYHNELKEAYNKIKKNEKADENLSKLDYYFEHFNEEGLNIISQAYYFNDCCNEYNESHITLLSQKDIILSLYQELIDSYDSNYKLFHEQFTALIAELEAIEFKESWFNFKLPFIFFPIVFGLSSFIPFFIYICDFNK